MEFNIKIWKKYYDRVQQLGNMLKDGRPDNDGNPPVSPLSLDDRNSIEFEIKDLTDKSNHYLDRCGMKCPEPTWIYNHADPKTWASHESFAYGHLMEF